MDVSELLDKTRGEINPRRVFGEPVLQGDAIIIPAARVSGGAGGGEGKGPSEQGSGAGSGFGLSARPVGAFVIRQGDVEWRPAIDVNRIILGGQIVAAVGLLVLGTVLRARHRTPGLRSASRGLRRILPILRAVG
ncbi:GerW family sporulation protein [Hyalangium gracile]|uniref:GerW family sporulation protein n=1 Tax=Hyalangium gracile TaxID=394092 RepID=UPI001CCB8BA8|nr:spore germination protein GerW family protein [Hyalangium gracile]